MITSYVPLCQMSLSRRKLLGLCASGVATGLAGCSSVVSADTSLGTVTASAPTPAGEDPDAGGPLAEYELVEREPYVDPPTDLVDDSLVVVEPDGAERTDPESAAWVAWMVSLRDRLAEAAGHEEFRDALASLEEYTEYALAIDAANPAALADQVHEILPEIRPHQGYYIPDFDGDIFGAIREHLDVARNLLEVLEGIVATLERIGGFEGGVLSDVESFVDNVGRLADDFERFGEQVPKVPYGEFDVSVASPGTLRGLEALNDVVNGDPVDWLYVSHTVVPAVNDYEAESRRSEISPTSGIRIADQEPSSLSNRGGIVGDIREYIRAFARLARRFERIEENAQSIARGIRDVTLGTGIKLAKLMRLVQAFAQGTARAIRRAASPLRSVHTELAKVHFGAQRSFRWTVEDIDNAPMYEVF